MSPVRLNVAQYASFSNLALPELPHTARVHVFGSDQIRAGTDDTAAASGLVTDPSGAQDQRERQTDDNTAAQSAVLYIIFSSSL